MHADQIFIFWAYEGWGLWEPYEGWGAYEGSGEEVAPAHKMHKFKKRAPSPTHPPAPRALFELVHFV